jgi:putative heme-binding domain-containing protein
MNNPALTRELKETWGEIRQTDLSLQKTIARFEKALSPGVLAKGEKARGRVLFQSLCAGCHRLYGQGGNLGPDLTGSGRADLDYLLENIVAPNAVVPAEYQMSILELRDGRVLSGVISANDDRTLTLQTPDGELKVEKSTIAKTTRLPDSLMPPGLLDPLSLEQTRDLMAYLMHPRQVALPEETNQPEPPKKR